MKQSYEIFLDIALPDTLEEQVEKPVAQTILTVKDLEKELLVLRLAFGKLKATAASAFAPLTAVLARAMSGAVWWATRLVKLVGQVISGLFGITGAGKMVEKTVKKAGKSVDRSLASFDQLNRLQKNSAGGNVVTTQTVKPVNTQITEDAQKIIDKIHMILAPLREIDDFPIRWALARLDEQIVGLADVAGQLLGKLWHDHLAPFVVWLAEKAAPTIAYLANRVLQFLQEGLSQAGEGFLQMLSSIKPLTDFLLEVLLGLIDQTGRLFLRMRQSMEADGSALKELFVTLGAAVARLWQEIAPTVRQIYGAFVEAFRGVGDSVFSVMQSVIRVITGAVQVISAALTGDWKQVWKGMEKVAENAVNGIIGVLNALISGLTGAVNGVIALLNKLKIKVPDWVPGYGGKEFGFSLKSVKAPQIPYLAKGAVLPANQPFLAVVGDQKHGTNIEAPLATIQEAVALVMQDQAEAMMAGFNALLQENRQLRRTVEGIEVGDAVIGQAANRYNRRQAVVRGGAL